MEGTTRAEPGRMVRIDALRGIAALSVLFFHLLRNSPQTHLLVESAPAWLRVPSDMAGNGVAIFFVISGFVIGHSTARIAATPRSALRFAARRQVRLDPPYYVVMLVVVVAEAAQAAAGLVGARYSVGDIVLNALYLQEITDTPAVLAVAWTLCLEVQFYLVTMLLIVLAGRLPGGRDGNTGLSERGRAVFRVAVLLTGLASLWASRTPDLFAVWFIGTWWMFALGLVLSWYVAGQVSGRYATACLLVTAAVWGWTQVANGPGASGLGQWFALGTAGLIGWWIRTGGIRGNAPRALISAGTISYSLYLVHLPFITYFMGALLKVSGPAIWAAWLAYFAGLVGSIVAAVVLYRTVERRSIRWSRAVALVPRDGQSGRRPDPPR